MRESRDPRDWWARALVDYQIARDAYEKNAGVLAVGIYALAQQACEKMLKAYLLKQGLSPEHKHDLDTIGLKACETLPGLQPLLPTLTDLGSEYLTSRYPMEDASIFVAKDAEIALACVEQLYRLLKGEFEGQ